MAIDKVDLSGGMNLEEMTLVVSPAAVSNRGASQTGEKKPRRELARKKIPMSCKAQPVKTITIVMTIMTTAIIARRTGWTVWPEIA
ncbi:MAG: hypothetical protein WAL56_02900 [Candidatus Sulfotelmatobacter sp.]